MEPISLVKEISGLMSAHEVPYHVEDEWVVPYGRLPALRATWYPREDSGRLDVEVLLEDQRVVYECFSGVGKGAQGITDAIQNFCVNSFHVFLSAFWEVHDTDQVMTEKWKIGESTYTAYIGNFGTRGSAGIEAEIPKGLFDTIESAVKNEVLRNDLCWFRCFFCDVKGNQTFEALKNNDDWEAGLSALKSLSWPASNGYYSVRIFLVVRANA